MPDSVHRPPSPDTADNGGASRNLRASCAARSETLAVGCPRTSQSCDSKTLAACHVLVDMLSKAIQGLTARSGSCRASQMQSRGVYEVREGKRTDQSFFLYERFIKLLSIKGETGSCCHPGVQKSSLPPLVRGFGYFFCCQCCTCSTRIPRELGTFNRGPAISLTDSSREYPAGRTGMLDPFNSISI
ncbi:hypothetical protein VTK56DRAFT_7466 [Thermocarpiscus australiensis]